MNTTWNPEGLKTVCVDFNGVLDMYEGFVPGKEYPPRPGAGRFLRKLALKYKVIILTAANIYDVLDWLNRNDLKEFVYNVTNTKPPAIAYIDDRAITFNGNFDETMEALDNFRCHWENDMETPRK